METTRKVVVTSTSSTSIRTRRSHAIPLTPLILVPFRFDVEDGSPQNRMLLDSPGTALHPPGTHQRRESFLYRNDSEFEISPKSNSRTSSVASDSHSSEDYIVTPFAQLLASLKNVRNNCVILTNVANLSSSRETDDDIPLPEKSPSAENAYSKLAKETLDELDWCLEQLETIQSHKSVGDMAFSKFKRMLNKELSHFSSESKAGSQISDYICNTFLDKTQDFDLTSLKEESEPLSSVTSFTTPSSSTRIGHTMSRISGVRKSLSHANSMSVIPRYGTEAKNEEELDEIMSGLNTWGIDIFALSESSNDHPLVALGYSIFKDKNLLHTFKIPSMTLVNFLMTLEDHYLKVPYHNFIHAADVTQSCHVLLLAPALNSVFSDLEILALLISALIHDVDHPGLTNQYLVNASSELALMYNDDSVLENHSLAVAFKLFQDEACDIFINLTKKQRHSLRKMAIDLVLATDMSKHMNLLADLKTMVETKKVTGSGVLLLDNYTERIQVLQNILHCADLSNPTKPLPIYKKWVDCIMEEFFQQGDKEKEIGIEISPMCDRDNCTVEKTQVGFIDYIVYPLWETWGDLVRPDAQIMLDILEENRDFYINSIPTSPQAKRKTSDKLRPTSPSDLKFQVTIEEPEDEGSPP